MRVSGVPSGHAVDMDDWFYLRVIMKSYVDPWDDVLVPVQTSIHPCVATCNPMNDSGEAPVFEPLPSELAVLWHASLAVDWDRCEAC